MPENKAGLYLSIHQTRDKWRACFPFTQKILLVQQLLMKLLKYTCDPAK